MSTEAEDPVDERPLVAASESELIAMARGLVTPHAYDMWALFSSPRTLPRKIGPTCASLLQDALSQVWPALWRRDAARPGASIEPHSHSGVLPAGGKPRPSIEPLSHSGVLPAGGKPRPSIEPLSHSGVLPAGGKPRPSIEPLSHSGVLPAGGKPRPSIEPLSHSGVLPAGGKPRPSIEPLSHSGVLPAGGKPRPSIEPLSHSGVLPAGGKPRPSIKNGRVVRGRGWERHPPTPLEFSSATIHLLRWLVSVPLATAGSADELAARPLAIGDQVAIYLALDAATDTPAQATIARQPMVRAAPLAWLGFAHLMIDASEHVPNFESLTTGAGTVVVEALSLEIATRWRSIEIAKRAQQDPDRLVALGAAQDAALTAFMDACDRAQRRDLAGFILDAASPLLERGIGPFPGELDLTKPLSSRAAARLAAGSLLRGVARWRQWDDAHRAVRFFDDDYVAAQLLLTRFERIGRAGVDRTDLWLAELASLAPTLASASATIEPP